GWRLLIQVVFWILFTGLLTVLMFSIGPPIAPDDAILSARGAIAMLGATLASVALAARFLDRRPLADFGLRFSPRWWEDFAFGLALGAILMTGVFLTQWTAGWIVVSDTLQTVDASAPFALAILSPFVAFVCVGIYEELLTRGYWLRNLAEGLNAPALGARGAIIAAWVLSSVFFGLLHATNPGSTVVSTFNLVIAGIFLGLGYVLTGQLAIPIGVHITWNFFQGNVYGFPVSGIQPARATVISISQGGPDVWTGAEFGPEAGLIGLAAIAVGSLLTLLWVRSRHGRVALETSLARPPRQAASDAPN
ncbi:MAG TPA: type II CAAX endopeptidase family protein, partial [Chloroflexota bacterium]|nr:type II CAAX endopeptidase family protein [Chloroflexota bacterium]